MRIKLDENLPHRLATILNNMGHQVHTAYQERLVGHKDEVIWEAAQREARFLITQDLDFSDTRKFAAGTHHGILVIRLQSPSRANLIDRIVELYQEENIEGWSGCFVVATERKIRVTKPAR